MTATAGEEGPVHASTIGTPPSTWRSWVVPAVSLALLNTSLTFENVWPTPKIRWGAALSVELAVGVVLLALAHRWAGRLTRHVLPSLWVLLIAGRYLDVTAPGLYGRDFNLYWDAQHLGNVTAMLARAVPWWFIAATIGSAAIVTAVAFVLSRLAIGHVASAMTHPGPRRTFGSTATFVVACFAAQQLSATSFVAFADPVSHAYARQARYVLAMVGPGATAPALGASPTFESHLRGLEGADVLLIFLESYGAVTFEQPRMAAELAEARALLDTAIATSGRQAASAYVDSPTFGASSWLAHLSLLSGVEVRDQYAYTSLMASTRETVLTHARRHGYRTVGLMPGMRQAWPEGAFYDFDVIYGHDALKYSGPRFGWWAIPDQFALAQLDALERATTDRAPVFVVFPTSTTHAPFGPVPPYQPDWSRLLTAHPYDPADVERAMSANPDLANLTPSYLKALAYDLQTLAGYLHQQADDPILIVIGDHQPPAAVSGTNAPWRVPVHVVARRDHILRRLVEHGFRSGLTPSRPSVGPMHALLPILLDAFDATADVATD
jgi:hypothetical protein